MVILRIFMLAVLFNSSLALAQDDSAPLEYIFPRTEYTNAGLLNGINYNVWWYRAFSLGTSWDGPEETLSQIRSRADRSSEDAEELLIELSKILKDEEPAGTYIVELYELLLNKAQKNEPMKISTFETVISDRGFFVNSNDVTTFDYTKTINKELVDFILKDLKLPLLSLRETHDLEVFNKILEIYLHSNINTNIKRDNLTEMINLVIQSDSEDLKTITANKIFSIKRNQIYFSNYNSEITHRAAFVLNLRKNILDSLSKEKRKEIVLDKIKSFRITNTYDSYFNYKKIEHDLLILEQIGGQEALMLVADIIEQIVNLLESIDKSISNNLSRISHSVGYSSRSSSNYIGSSYSSGSGGVSSQDAARTLRSLRLLRGNTVRELQESIEMAIAMCDKALENNDILVLETCANDLVTRFMTVSSESGTPNDAKQILNRAVESILSKTSEYFKPEHFTTTCTEIDLEKGASDTQEALKEIEGLKVRIPTRYEFQTSYGVSNSDVTHFMFVDCTKPEYAVLHTPRNMTYSHLYESYTLVNVFFLDSTTIASCINPTESQSSDITPHTSGIYNYYNGNQITLQSAKLHNYLVEVNLKYSETLSFLQKHEYDEREYDDTSPDNSQLTEDEEVFSAFFTSKDGNYRQSNPVSSLGNLLRHDSDLYSGKLLPTLQKKICLAHNVDGNINCEEDGDEITCKDHSLFKVTFSPKND